MMLMVDRLAATIDGLVEFLEEGHPHAGRPAS